MEVPSAVLCVTLPVAIIRTFSKPRRRRKRRCKTKDLMNRTIAKHLRLKLCTFLSRPPQNNNVKSSKFAWPVKRNPDSRLLFFPLGNQRRSISYAEVNLRRNKRNIYKFPHSPILHDAFSSWIEKTMTKTIHCHWENRFVL